MWIDRENDPALEGGEVSSLNMATTYYDAMEALAPLLVLQDDILDHTALRPSAIMVPLGAFPGLQVFHGLSVIRGDRFALLYEAPKVR